MPLPLRAHAIRVCPVKDCPHFLIRILNCCASQSETTEAIKLMIGERDFSCFILNTVDFVDYYARPWQGVQNINVPSSEIERGDN